MYALVEIKGKQYKAEKGSLLKIDKVQEEAGKSIVFDSVLLTKDGEKMSLGTPYVSGAKVKVVVEETKKDPKVNVLKYKRRKGYKRTQGHRQTYSFVRVEEITGA
jgi:large subunit ribosomal protein L21